MKNTAYFNTVLSALAISAIWTVSSFTSVAFAVDQPPLPATTGGATMQNLTNQRKHSVNTQPQSSSTTNPRQVPNESNAGVQPTNGKVSEASCEVALKPATTGGATMRSLMAVQGCNRGQ